MKSGRRHFIKAGLFAGASLASGLPAAARAVVAREAQRPMEVLILGGTGFIGPHMVREMLRRGHSVTLFNRGRTNNELFPDLETIKGDRDGGLDGLKGRNWHAVVDNSGYVPRHVQDSARLLAGHIKRYLFISSVSAYADFDIVNSEESPLATMADESIEEITAQTYGALKALCERRAAAEIDADGLTVLRPTYIAGPGDNTDRFSYWPIRTREGGEMIWPGTPDDTVQLIDVRDLVNFVVDCLESDTSGTFNMATGAGDYTMGKMLNDAQAVTASTVEPVWISEEFAYEQGLVGGRELPIWHPKTGANAAGGSFNAERAGKAGLRNRPERETMRDLLAWWHTLPAERTGKLRAGLNPDREAAVIAAWKAKKR
ncbi:MAG: NAD-dependent epimerase/dehydratase family protein [Gammaproteobacteria bacterium]|nr:NAD-dependent epimerase/dehydratase family protein [Gammaproteobacteria bacterium]